MPNASKGGLYCLGNKVMKKVIIIQKGLPHYRFNFYQQLSASLKSYDVELSLIYGKYRGDDHNLEGEVAKEPWMQLVNSCDVSIGNVHFYYQPCLKFLKGADLIIMLQWNSLLINYYLIARRLLKLSKTKLAFWGHGQNQQVSRRNWRNIFKKIFINQVDWWFVYTEGVKKIVSECNFPEDRITVVQNAIDTKVMGDVRETIAEDEIEEAKKSLGIKSGPIAIYCGKMYEEKRIPFLIEACMRIKKAIPTFQMIFIGDGEFKEMISDLSENEDWIHCLPSIAGKEKLIYFSLSDLLLMPGVVGLVALDSFVTETPIVTTNFEFHSPEIEYIENDRNGVITENMVEVYADKIIDLLRNKQEIERLKEGCRLSAQKHTIEKMVKNFTEGIIQPLSL